MSRRFDPGSLSRVVVKLGSSSIINDEGLVRLGFLGKLVTTIGRMRKHGIEFVVVSSGAIALGAKRLGLAERPVNIQEKQACASIGQTELMTLYQKLFDTLPLQTGQVLLTRDDLEDRRRYLNARETLLHLLKIGVVPIINENDSVSVDEIKFGDNDELSALTAGLVDADLLIMLTDVDGLYSGDPSGDSKGRLIERIEQPLEELLELAVDHGSPFGLGGMRSKLKSANLCRSYGIPCLIARSRGSVFERALGGESVGTYVVALKEKVPLRHRWLASAAHADGVLVLDDGATEAICHGGKSLLPSGISEVRGEFLRGAVVVLSDARKREIARGVVRYGSPDLVRILGKHASQIEPILGFTFGDEIVHRDHLVLTG